MSIVERPLQWREAGADFPSQLAPLLASRGSPLTCHSRSDDMAFQSVPGDMDDLWWGKVFEPFYGSDYCLRVTMDLEKLRDEKYQGNTFQFQEGWVKPTVELLTRLRNQGFPARTKDYILIHLSCPLESMAYGELYFQVGRKIPGRLSLKFTRRQLDGNIVIQPTVLKVEEEQQLAYSPCQYLASLREHARASQPDPQRILTTLILVNGKCERQRINVNVFLQNLNDPMNRWYPSAQQAFPRYPGTPVDQTMYPMFPYDGLNSFPVISPRMPTTPCLGPRQARSASQGNILHFNSPPQKEMPRFVIPGRPEHEPVENDETSQLGSRSGSSGGASGGNQATFSNCQIKEQPKTKLNYLGPDNKNQPNNIKSTLPVEEYVDTVHAVQGDVEERRSSNDSGSGRTSIQDEYKIMSNALSSMSIGNSTPSEDLEVSPLAALGGTNAGPRKPSYDTSHNGAWTASMLPNVSLLQGAIAARSPTSAIHSWLQQCPSVTSADSLSRTIAEEEYTGTVQALHGSSMGPESWLSHHLRDSQFNYRINQNQPPMFSMDPPSLIYTSMTGQPIMIPITVEELNNRIAQHQNSLHLNIHPK